MYNLSASSSQPSSSAAPPPSIPRVWLGWEGKLLELGLSEIDLTAGDHLAERIAARLPWKRLEYVREYYVELVMQIESVELGVFDAMLREGRLPTADQLAGFADNSPAGAALVPQEQAEEDDDQSIALPSMEEMRQMQRDVMGDDDHLPPYLVQGVADLSVQNYNNNIINNNNINGNINNNNNNTETVAQSSNFFNYMNMADHGRDRSTDLPQYFVSPQSRKGKSWTEEEHRLFLMGMNVYGKGDWKSIARNFVTTRSSTQVASHAQKYFKRLEKHNQQKRRPSIHDIRTITVPLRSGPQERTRSIYDMVDLIRPPIRNSNQMNINQLSTDGQAPSGSFMFMGSTNNAATQRGAPTPFQGAGVTTLYNQLARVGAGSTTSHQFGLSTFPQGAAGARASIPYYGAAAATMASYLPGAGYGSLSSAAAANPPPPFQQLTSPFLLPEAFASMSDLMEEEQVGESSSHGNFPSNPQ